MTNRQDVHRQGLVYIYIIVRMILREVESSSRFSLWFLQPRHTHGADFSCVDNTFELQTDQCPHQNTPA